MNSKAVNLGLSLIIRSGAFCLALCFLFPLTALAANYELPRDIGSGPFSSCSLNSGTLYTCSGSVMLTSASGDRITFTQSMTLRIDGAFSMQNNSRMVNSGHAVLIGTTGSHDITLGNGNISSVNFSAGGDFSAGNNANITGNVSAGGTISIANNGTVSGFCFPANSRCLGTNGCVSSALGGDTLITCTRDGAVNIPAGVTSLRYLLVGGGGGGGGIKKDDAGGSGGGGGGAVRTGTILGAFPSATYYVSVGEGGSAGFFNETTGTGSAGGIGGTSSFYILTASGGAGGATQDINNQNGSNGSNGGSAGGGRTTGAGGTTTTPRPPNGYPGGNGATYGSSFGTAAGGGGGANSTGSSGIYDLGFLGLIADSIGGNGGNGLSNNISGSAVTYGGGGGGGTGRTGTWFTGTISGGLGRDGGGSAPDTRGPGNPGLANRGGGGSGATGSASGSGYSGGSGGSGIVILRFPTVSGPHHIRLLHDGEGLTCAPESITVRACANADCTIPYTADSISVTLNSVANATWSSNPVSTNPASGTAIVTLRKTDSTQAPNPVTLGVAAPYAGRCFIGASENCNMTFHDAGFVFDVPNHVAETSQTVTIRAVKKSDSGVACVPAFASTSKPVNFTCAYGNPVTGTLPLRVSGAALNAANSATTACDVTGQTLNLAFNAAGAASINVLYADVGNMTLNARHSDSGLVMTGNDPFIAAPASFALAASAPFIAGQSFTTRVTGRNASAQTTPNFGRETPAETVEFKNVTAPPVSPTNSELVGPTGGQTGMLTAGAFTPAKCSPAVAGVVCDNTLAWSEVGDLTLSAVLKSGSYLGSGFSAWGSGSAGPFRPAYLITELADAAGNATGSQPCGTFTYSGQPFRLRITAMRPANTLAFGAGDAAAPTRNYTAAYAKAVTLGRDEASACTPLTTGFSHFTLSATGFTSGMATTPPASNVTAPLPIAFVQAIAAPGTVPVCARDSDGVNSHGQIQATLNIRNGRLWISNAYGSELLPLPIPLRAEYYDGTRWALNAADNCTSLPVPGNGSGLDMHLLSGGSTTASLNSPLLAGNAGFRLSAPGAGHTGYVDITIAAPDYLKAAGGSNPAARAAFGMRKTPLIYRRENF